MVGIVVVTYNRLALLKKNIESLRSQTYKAYRIIVVNNGSTDGTEQWLSQQSDLLTINQDNSGGAGGFCTGLRYVSENQFDYCWLMDDDVICSPCALEELINASNILNGINYGFLCSSVFDINNNPCNVPDVSIKVQKGYAEWSRFLLHSLVKVRCATFVSVFIPVKNIQEVGLPIKEFFIWGDDTEYTIRLSRKYPSYMVGKSIVSHLRVMTDGLSFLKETNPERIHLYYYMFRNQYYIGKHGYWEKSMPKIRYFVTKFLLLGKALSKCKFIHAKVVARAIVSSVLFNPKIEYPVLRSEMR